MIFPSKWSAFRRIAIAAVFVAAGALFATSRWEAWLTGISDDDAARTASFTHVVRVEVDLTFDGHPIRFDDYLLCLGGMKRTLTSPGRTTFRLNRSLMHRRTPDGGALTIKPTIYMCAKHRDVWGDWPEGTDPWRPPEMWTPQIDWTNWDRAPFVERYVTEAAFVNPTSRLKLERTRISVPEYPASPALMAKVAAQEAETDAFIKWQDEKRVASGVGITTPHAFVITEDLWRRFPLLKTYVEEISEKAQPNVLAALEMPFARREVENDYELYSDIVSAVGCGDPIRFRTPIQYGVARRNTENNGYLVKVSTPGNCAGPVFGDHIFPLNCEGMICEIDILSPGVLRGVRVSETKHRILSRKPTIRYYGVVGQYEFEKWLYHPARQELIMFR